MSWPAAVTVVGTRPAHGPFLLGAGAALGQHMDFAVLRQELHPQLGTDFLPGFFSQFLFQLGQPALGGADQGDDHWHAVRTLVPAGTEAAGLSFMVRHGALEVGGGQIVEQPVELRAEEIAPTLAQMGEERVLVCEQTVQAAIAGVVLGQAFIGVEQIGQRRGAKPMPVQPLFSVE